jgi:hypothetical protein
VLAGFGLDIDADDYDAAPAVQLSADRKHARVTCDVDLSQPAGAGPSWVQIATAGNYAGYAGGAFVFDAQVFAQTITNFRANPSYRAGTSDVIPWDFNHASASFAADGSIPISGTPAQGWIQELQCRAGADGVLQLWALTRWLEPARSYIQAGQYRWASVVVGFDCRDAKTGANIGAVLESVALTNNPFIEGMQPLVAASRHGGLSPKKEQKMPNLQLTRQPNGSYLLSAAAEVGPSTSGYSSGAVNPPLNGLPNLDQTFFQECLSAAKKIDGFQNQRPEDIAAWLRSIDTKDQLGLADRHRCAIIVGTLIKSVVGISRPMGDDHGPTPVVDLLPTELSRKIDARPSVVAGRNPCERAIVALRAARGAGFTSLSWDDQCAIAASEIRAGRVVAS